MVNALTALLYFPISLVSPSYGMQHVRTLSLRGILFLLQQFQDLARSAEENKVKKYAALSDRYLFVPVAIETSGVLGPLSLGFLEDIGHRAARQRHEPRECEWFFQRISLAVVRGNAHAVLSSCREMVGS